MLNSMTQKVLSTNKGEIFFSNETARDNAKRHNTGDGVPKRKFFGINKNDNDRALKLYEQNIKEARRKLGL